MNIRQALSAFVCLATYANSSMAEVPAICDCGVHLGHDHTTAFSAQTSLSLPEGLPQSLSVAVELEGQTMTLELEKHSVFGQNTRFFATDATGRLSQIELCSDCSYLGTVTEHPDFIVSAILYEEGLMASIIRPNAESIQLQPINGDRKRHHIFIGELSDESDQASRSPHLAESTELPAALTTAITESPLELDTSKSSAGLASSVNTSTATLPPTRVMEVREYEIGVEIGSRAFLSTTAGSYQGNLATAQASAASVITNLDARYLRAAGIKHRLGTVIIRTDESTDPLRESVTATGGSSGALSSLNAFRDHWNSNPLIDASDPSKGRIGTTHDLAVYHVFSAPSGLAYVNSVGTSNRYATSGGRGATSWANGTLVHEFGHSWNLRHLNEAPINQYTFDPSTPPPNSFYEARPRRDGDSANGSHTLISVMSGDGSQNIGRLATDEANTVFSARQNRLQFGDLVSNPANIPPYGHRDTAISQGSAITIDVIANDYDANNHVLDAHLRDTVSHQGGTISLSEGTGPGGRNEITYTPPADFNGTDFFHYNVCDSTGQTDWGAVYITVSAPSIVDLSQARYLYDLGPAGSVVFDNDHEVISERTFGEISFVSEGENPVETRDRGVAPGTNNINRDHIRLRSDTIFSHRLATGFYNILFTVGDRTENTAPIRITAENKTTLTTELQSPAEYRNYTLRDVPVIDGDLTVNIENLGFSANFTRLIITRVGDSTRDADADGIFDVFEVQFFGDLTTANTQTDNDADGLTDLLEFQRGGNPTLADTDGDTLSDGDEVFRYDTDLTLADSDNDRFDDALEVLYRSDPRNASSTPIVPDLVAYYPFDEGTGSTAANLGSLGGSADATQNQGTIGWTSTGQRIGQASLSLSGNASLLAASPIPSSAREFTISVWVNPNTDGGFRGIYTGREHPGNWGVNLEDGRADIRFANPAGTSSAIDTAPDSLVANGGWYHVVQTWESSGTSSIGRAYINGVLAGTTTAGRADFTQPTDGFTIGDDTCCVNREFDGQIDDLAVLTRALTPEEVSAAYTAGQNGNSIITALATPLVPPTVTNLAVNSNSRDVTFQFNTEQQLIYRIYTSPNLVDWTLEETITGTGTPFLFTDPTRAENHRRFFYAVE